VFNFTKETCRQIPSPIANFGRKKGQIPILDPYLFMLKIALRPICTNYRFIFVANFERIILVEKLSRNALRTR
jgi:hypothetical protein